MGQLCKDRGEGWSKEWKYREGWDNRGLAGKVRGHQLWCGHKCIISDAPANEQHPAWLSRYFIFRR